MTVLEMLALVGAVGAVVAQWAPPPVRRVSTIVAAGVVGAALLADLRWQLVPVLVGTALAVLVAVVRRQDAPARRRWPAVLVPVICLGAIAAGPAAAWAFPVPEFPEPTGPYTVGSTVHEWTDRDRPEPATPDPADRRRMAATLWYPARDAPSDADRAPYLGRTEREAGIVAAAMATDAGLPGFLLGSVPRARTRAVPDAPPAAGRFPVVLFSPGSGGVRTQNTGWAEELAGRGYVVAAVDHLHDSAAVVLAGGEVVRSRMPAAYAEAWASADPAAEDRVTAEFVALRAADLSSTLTRLGRLDRGEVGGPLAGRLDVDRAAVTGHSFGGATALTVAGADPRFDAAVDLDGGLGVPLERPFPQPVLAITSPAYHDTEGNPDYAVGLDRALDLAGAPSYRLTVPGTAHFSFTDLPLFLPPLPAVAGSLGRADGTRIAADATATFLDHVLRGAPGDPAADLARYGDLAVHER